MTEWLRTEEENEKKAQKQTKTNVSIIAVWRGGGRGRLDGISASDEDKIYSGRFKGLITSPNKQS